MPGNRPKRRHVLNGLGKLIPVTCRTLQLVGQRLIGCRQTQVPFVHIIDGVEHVQVKFVFGDIGLAGCRIVLVGSRFPVPLPRQIGEWCPHTSGVLRAHVLSWGPGRR